MSLSTGEFWKLLATSRLASVEECRRLAAEFGRNKRDKNVTNPTELAQWLVGRGVLNRYQAKVLLSGRSGPFIFGDYQIRKPITSGRLRGLFRAVHMPTRHPVCLAVIPAASIRGADAAAQFESAASGAVRLVQPNLCRVYQFLEVRNQRLVVLEDLQGQSLAEQGQKSGALPVAEASHIAHQLALGLAALSEAGISHGAVCPENVWIDTSGNAKLLHFPFCGTTIAAPFASAENAIAFGAPEVADKANAANGPADVYSLGATLRYMLAGRAPRVTRTSSGRAVPLSLPAEVPATVTKLIGYMVAARPSDRYQDAKAAAEALVPYVDPAALARLPEPPTPAAQAYERWLAEQKESAGRAAPDSLVDDSPEPAVVEPADAAVDASPEPSTASVAVEEVPSEVSEEGLPEISIPSIATTTADPRLERFRRSGAPRTRSRMTMYLTVASVLVLASALGVGWWLWSRQPAPVANIRAATTPVSPVVDVDPPTLPVDDGKMLWESPTSGEPLELSYVVSGARVVIAWRPAAMLENPEGARLLSALGSFAERVREELHQLVGAPLENIERLLVGMFPGEGDEWQMSIVATLREPVAEEDLLAVWNQPMPTEVQGRRVYRGERFGYLVETVGEQQRIVVAPWPEMEALVAAGDQPPVLRRELEALLPATDRDRQFTLLSTTAALFEDRKSVLPLELAGLAAPLEQFLGRGTPAVLASCHLGDDCFLELRVEPRADQQPLQMVSTYRRQLEEVPQEVEEHLASLEVSEYSRPILDRFPRMLDTLAMYSRVDSESSQVVLRIYLPTVAAHNVALATRLALAEANKVPGEVATPTAMTMDDRLKKPVTLRFPRQTLETALQILSEEIGAPIEILGGDLQLEGITKNQSFGLDLEATPAAEVLHEILLKASAEGKLVYTIKADPATGTETIYVTTRKAAAQRGDPLPDGFEPSAP